MGEDGHVAARLTGCTFAGVIIAQKKESFHVCAIAQIRMSLVSAPSHAALLRKKLEIKRRIG